MWLFSEMARHATVGELKFNTDKGVREEDWKPGRPRRMSTK